MVPLPDAAKNFLVSSARYQHRPRMASRCWPENRDVVHITVFVTWFAMDTSPSSVPNSCRKNTGCEERAECSVRGEEGTGEGGTAATWARGPAQARAACKPPQPAPVTATAAQATLCAIAALQRTEAHATRPRTGAPPAGPAFKFPPTRPPPSAPGPWGDTQTAGACNRHTALWFSTTA